MKWLEYSGRDREGDLRKGIHLIGENSRVLGCIDYPQVDEVSYHVSVGNSEREYLDMYAAKRWAEQEAAEFLEDEDRHQKFRKEYRDNKAKETACET